MAQPSFKNLLKRSRSAIDPAADREEIVRGIALACAGRVADGDVLFTSRLWTGMGFEEVSSNSQMAQIVTNSSVASKLFFSADSIRAVTLARSPSYPFDSNKALMRRLLAVGREEGAFSERVDVCRRRKCTVEHVKGGPRSNENVAKASLPSLQSSANINCSDACSQEGSVIVREHSQVPAKGTHIRSPLGDLSSVDLSVVVPLDSSALQITENVEGTSRSLVNGASQPSLTRVSVKAVHTKDTQIVATPVAAKVTGCISRQRCPQFGLLSLCGRRREMEDTCSAQPDFVLIPCDALGGCHCSSRESCASSSFHFFGVFDGHGGSQASSFCKARLYKALTEELIKDIRSCRKAVSGPQSDWSTRWKRVMETCFLRIDEEVGGVCPTGGCSSLEGNPSCCLNPIAPDNVGTTAVVAVIGPCQIIVANCGDSRAVLSRGGSVIPLSNDHKPDRDDESNRIVAAGGKIIYWDGCRVGGLLAMSRAIGDRFLKNYVISVPEVTCIERTKEDECLILASDGLWDVVSNEMACYIARRRLRSQRRRCAFSDNPSAEETPAGAAAALLTKLALSRGSKDNITVLVIDLKSHCKKQM